MAMRAHEFDGRGRMQNNIGRAAAVYAPAVFFFLTQFVFCHHLIGGASPGSVQRGYNLERPDA